MCYEPMHKLQKLLESHRHVHMPQKSQRRGWSIMPAVVILSVHVCCFTCVRAVSTHDEDELDEKADEAHHYESQSSLPGDAPELCGSGAGQPTGLEGRAAQQQLCSCVCSNRQMMGTVNTQRDAGHRHVYVGS